MRLGEYAVFTFLPLLLCSALSPFQPWVAAVLTRCIGLVILVHAYGLYRVSKGRRVKIAAVLQAVLGVYAVAAAPDYVFYTVLWIITVNAAAVFGAVEVPPREPGE